MVMFSSFNFSLDLIFGSGPQQFRYTSQSTSHLRRPPSLSMSYVRHSSAQELDGVPRFSCKKRSLEKLCQNLALKKKSNEETNPWVLLKMMNKYQGR